MGMIFGIGTDLVRCSRFRQTAARQPKILDRLFTKKEHRTCRKKGNPWPHFSARFAAKEAFVKAWGSLVGWHDIEIEIGKKGQPLFQVHGNTLKEMKKRKIQRCHLSISHEGDSATALVILET